MSLDPYTIVLLQHTDRKSEVAFRTLVHMLRTDDQQADEEHRLLVADMSSSIAQRVRFDIACQLNLD